MEFLLGETLHAHEETAATAVLSGPAFNLFVELAPASEIQVSNAEIATFGILHRELQRRKKLLIYVVEDARHSLLPARFGLY